MIAEKVLFTVIALAAAAAAAAVAVFGIAFAIFALLREVLTPAGAAAVMALVAALGAAGLGLFAASHLKFRLTPPDERKRDGKKAPPSMVERVVDIVRDRPFVAAGAAIAAGLIAWRNPAIIAALARTFIEPPRRRDRR